MLQRCKQCAFVTNDHTAVLRRVEQARREAYYDMTTIEQHWPLAHTKESDSAEFDALFLAHYDRVYGLLFRLVGTRVEAEDLAQEVFLKLYRTPPRKRNSNIGAWLYRVATHTGYNAIRSRRRRWERNTLLLQAESATGVDPEHQAERTETQAAVRAALAQLSPQQGQLLLLRQMGLSYAELATVCELNPASVGKTLSRAATAFRAAYLTTNGSDLHA